MECSVRSIALNRYVKYFDGQWQGIVAASDGACYFGASTHSPKHGSSFFKFEPHSSELTVLVEDMTPVCGEDLTKTPPQGKIHSPIVEFEGWLYFTTHLSNYWDEAMDRYTGAHVIGYELSTGSFRDYGIVRPRSCPRVIGCASINTSGAAYPWEECHDESYRIRPGGQCVAADGRAASARSG